MKRKALQIHVSFNAAMTRATVSVGELGFTYKMQMDQEMDMANLEGIGQQLLSKVTTGRYTAPLASEPDITEFGRVFRVTHALRSNGKQRALEVRRARRTK